MRYRDRVRLPPELVDYTIDYLHDCPSTLRICARVCRAWLSPSRFHLFYRVVIEPRHLREAIIFRRCRDLYRLLQKSPGIALYIRDFKFSVGYEGRVMMLESEWPHLRTVLPHLLGILTELRRLTLVGIDWTSLTPDIRASFRAVFALPTLVHIETTCLEFSKLKHFTMLLHPPLKRLTVCAGWNEILHGEAAIRAVDEEDENVVMHKRKPCHLEYLRSNLAYASPEFINWLLGAQSVIDISAIRTLDAWCNSKCAENSMAMLIKRLGPSLENLTIYHPEVTHWDGSLVDTIDVGCNPNIRRLAIVVGGDDKLVPYLKCFLSRLATPNIQRIIFSLVTREFNYRGWNEIDHVLAGTKFGTLKSVVINFGYGDMDAVYQSFIDQFPLLDAKGILHVGGHMYT